MDRTDEELMEMLTGIFERYQARPFRGAVDLFLSKPSCGAYCDDPKAAWTGLSTQQVSVHLSDVKNDWALLQEPEVCTTAARIRDILGRRYPA